MMDQAVTRAAGATPSTKPPAAAARRSWSILLTSANHGTVGPLGSTFPHAGEHHERVQVVEIVEAGAPPAPGTDLGGLVRLNAAELVDSLDEIRSWARELPIPTRSTVSAMQKVRQVKEALAGAPVAAQAGQVAATDEPNGGMHDSIFVKVWGDAGGGDTGRRALANYAYQLGKRDAAGQVAVPEGWALVPLEPTGSMKDAGAFSGLPVAHAHETWTAAKIYRVMVGAAPSAPAVAQQAPEQAAPSPAKESK